MARKLSALILLLSLVCGIALSADAEEKRKYKYYGGPDNMPIGWIDGYETGASWFGDNFAYDITDVEACWELIQKPITVLNVGEKEFVYPLDAPNGKRVVNEWQGGFINGSTAAVHVLGEDEGGWTLIEGLDYYNRIIRGYVRTKLLKTVTPHKNMGIIIDKMEQRLYMFIDGKLWSSCAISTGLPNEKQPYNETAAGEYLIGSWVGGFDSEGMYCEMGIRFNGGDLLHQVPYVTLADGTKRFDKYEAFLGEKASHGCVRVARVATDEGLNIKWLWENLKKGTKVVVWDDGGRRVPYPEDSLDLFYNPDGGQNYHSTANCSTVKSRYLPLTGFTYAQLDESPYSKLTPCPGCSPAKRRAEIDEINRSRGIEPLGQEASAVGEEPLTQEGDANTSVSSLDVLNENEDATQHPVEIVIIPSE